jgi:hypothetical protein
MGMRRLLLLAAGVGASVLAFPATAQAAAVTDAGNPTNGWGVVVSQQATTSAPGTIGQHVSSQPKPHQGLGNVARNDGAPGNRPGDHACFVDDLDTNPLTNCTSSPGKPAR